MIVNLGVEDVYTKTPNQRNTLRKISKKRKRQHSIENIENQKNIKCRNISYVGAYILDLSFWRFHPCPHQLRHWSQAIVAPHRSRVDIKWKLPKNIYGTI